jgi:hypothetical protein
MLRWSNIPSAVNEEVGLIARQAVLQPRLQEIIMLKKTMTMAALTSTLVFAAGIALAADQDQDRTRLQDQTKDQSRDRLQERDQDRIYGSHLMTRQERNEYRGRIRSAKTAEEREQIRAEHHERMRARAKERGVNIPDVPPPRGGMGGGMGPGGGGGMGGGGMGGGMGPRP